MKAADDRAGGGDARAELQRRVLAMVAAYAQSGASHAAPPATPKDPSEDTHLSEDPSEDTHLSELLRDLATYQYSRVEPYRRLCDARRVASTGADPGPPALPTDVFRYARVAGHPASEDTHLFRTSGTSSGARGAHPLRDMTLYDAAAEAHARHMLFPDVERIALVMLAAHPSDAPESSLSYMLARFEQWFGAGPAMWCLKRDRIDIDALTSALSGAVRAGRPLALLGTSFAFVFAEDALAGRTFALPSGSRLMQTGGYKGRSREVEPGELRALLSARYAIPEDFIVAEYGMTELSSQLYESTLRERLTGHSPPRRHLVPPPWVRATPVNPETLAPLPAGEVGVLRIDDAANLDSVAAILTGDLAARPTDSSRGIVLHGRASWAALRGCSVAVEEALTTDDAR